MLPVDRLIISPVLVGRTREVEALETVLHSVRQGTGQVVLLAGEAGVGKSRLVAELRQRAVGDHWTTLAGHCFEPDAIFPYAPLIDALRAFLGPQPAAVVADLLGVQAAELVKLLPELALAIATLRPTAPLDPEAEKRRLFEALLQFFTRLTQIPRSAPLLLILEDLHWCDETSLDFLHLLSRRIVAYRILLLATYRREEARLSLKQLLAQLSRGRLAHEIELQSLNKNHVDALLQAIFELGQPVRSEFLDALYTLTEGNPFFIEEVLKSLIAAGDVFYADGEWDRKPLQEIQIPASVQDAVQRRTAHLSDDARQLLTLAAVAGRRFDFALLQQVVKRDDHELLALIKALMAAQLVVEESTEQFAFRHALTRQAVYAELLGRERQALHRTIAEAIEHVYASALGSSTGSGTAAHIADLSYHFYEAGEWTKAFEYAWRGGKQAQAFYAPHAAVEHFTRALVAAQHLAQPPSLFPLYQARGLAYDTLGAFEQARSDLETALELAQAGGARREEWQALLDLGQLWASRDYAQTGDYFQQALALARMLDDPAMFAHSLNRVGNWHLNIDQPQEALHHHQEALAIFQAANDHRAIAQTFDLLGMASLLGGDLVQSAVYCKRASALFRSLDDRQGLASSLALLSFCGNPCYINTDTLVPAVMSMAECITYGEQAVQIAREIGWRAGESFTLGLAGHSPTVQGRYGEALAMIQRALQIAQEIEHRQWMCVAHRYLGVLYLDLLALPLAQYHLEQALTLANEMGSLFHAGMARGHLVSIYILQNEPASAETIVNTMLRPDLPMQTGTQRLAWQGRAELALAQGDPGLALQIADRLISSATNLENHDVGAIPYLAQLRGEALAALQHWTEAETMLLAALTAAHAQDIPRLIWRIHVALGKFYQAQARRAESEQAFAAARAIIEELAANVPDSDLRDNFVRQATALIPPPKPASPLQAAKQTYGGLTRREREVAALIAEGKSNRSIAEVLVLGERTVEGHVGNILAKLGFTSRAQIAVWAVEKGLMKDP